jgi:hypothetical protein
LLGILDKFSNEEVRKRKAINEIIQMCNQQSFRAKESAQHQIATGLAQEWFRRERFEGQTYLCEKETRGELVLTDLHLHHLLELFNSRITVSNAMDQLKKPDRFYEDQPCERERLSVKESQGLDAMRCIAVFMQDLRLVLSSEESCFDTSGWDTSPELGRDLFVPGLQGIDSELEQVKQEGFPPASTINLDDLLEPKMVEKVLERLAGFVKEKTGTSMEVIYREQVKEMIRTVEIPKRIAHATQMF